MRWVTGGCNVKRLSVVQMDCRVKPGNDSLEEEGRLPHPALSLPVGAGRHSSAGEREKIGSASCCKGLFVLAQSVWVAAMAQQVPQEWTLPLRLATSIPEYPVLPAG